MNRKIDQNRPYIILKNFQVALPFFHADVGKHACILCALASTFRIHGANLYKLCSNENLQEMLHMSRGQLNLAKKQLRDKGLLDYDGTPGDYTHLEESWERTTGLKWEEEL